jgi:hypothetical protein
VEIVTKPEQIKEVADCCSNEILKVGKTIRIQRKNYVEDIPITRISFQGVKDGLHLFVARYGDEVLRSIAIKECRVDYFIKGEVL